MIDRHNSVTVPQLAWSGDIDAELTFPDDWDVISCRMKGHDHPALSDEGFRKAFGNPIGCKPIRELARGKRNVVIIFDDLTRPTNFNVYNHNPYENCTYVGKTKRGTPVSLNAEFLDADLKIGIGCIVPHPMSGFGGGAKIILPGIASIDTIEYNHTKVPQEAQALGVEDSAGPGMSEDNALLLDMQETCQMSGLDVKVDAIVNAHRDTVALFVGEPIAEFQEGIKLAKQHYLSPVPENAEVIVSNANAKVNEATIANGIAQSLLSEDGGAVVLVSNNPYGEVPHYLIRSFGNHMGGRMWRPRALAPGVKKFILLMPWRDKVSADWLAPIESIHWAKTWDEVINMLKADYPGGARVGVIPDGTIQYFA